MKINFQLAHKISVIQALLRHDERLLEFFFSHKRPGELRDSPAIVIQETGCLSKGEQLLIRAALDVWCGEGQTKLVDLLDSWDHLNWAAFLRAMVRLHELDWSDGEFL